MPKGNYYIPTPSNEPVLTYAPGTPERAALKEAVAAARKEQRDIPMYIGGEEERTGNAISMSPPYPSGIFIDVSSVNDGLKLRQLWKCDLCI